MVVVAWPAQGQGVCLGNAATTLVVAAVKTRQEEALLRPAPVAVAVVAGAAIPTHHPTARLVPSHRNRQTHLVAARPSTRPPLATTRQPATRAAPATAQGQPTSGCTLPDALHQPLRLRRLTLCQS